MKPGPRPLPRLVPMGARLPNQKAEARLRQAWHFVVGPALAERTRPLRVQGNILVMGCWELSRIAPLREAATAVWPQVRDRIQRALGLSLMGLQIVPCDPPAEVLEQPKDPDPLRRALRLLEARRLERIRLGLESE
ncbi:DciA family protein [Geothrix sp. PMB-07]|uniref:DciA family protein n=1 Tax=Geothrix sp. PMB-07 TaxID=3068640 RepID=UPI002740CAB1|nr:DciA family protein [Geothrix sp. PMB-07]WLT32841.1 DciA family protein [Geothrix sp. PMB-07]